MEIDSCQHSAGMGPHVPTRPCNRLDATTTPDDIRKEDGPPALKPREDWHRSIDSVLTSSSPPPRRLPDHHTSTYINTPPPHFYPATAPTRVHLISRLRIKIQSSSSCLSPRLPARCPTLDLNSSRLTLSLSTPSPAQAVHQEQEQDMPLASLSMRTLLTLSPHPQAQRHAPTCLSLRHPLRHPHSRPASLRRPHSQYSRLSRVILSRRRGGSVSAVGHPRQALTAAMHHEPSSSRFAKTASHLISTTCRSRSAERMHGEPRSLKRACVTSEKSLLTFVVRGRGTAARASRCRFIW